MPDIVIYKGVEEILMVYITLYIELRLTVESRDYLLEGLVH